MSNGKSKLDPRTIFFVSVGVNLLLGILYANLQGLSFKMALGVLAAASTIGLVLFGAEKGEKGILIKIYTALGIAACIYLGVLIIQKNQDPEQYLFKRAVASKSDDKFKEYFAQYPQGAYREAALDSLAAIHFNKFKNNTYNRSGLYTFIDTCSRQSIKSRACRELDRIYNQYTSSGTELPKDFLQAYAHNYQRGSHYSEIKDLVYKYEEQDAYDFAVKAGTVGAYDNFLKSFPNGPHAKEIKQLRQNYLKDHKYDGNYLRTGSQPYANVYGRNSSYGNCSIKVNASGSSDVVVIVKHNNRYGSVAGHAYIHKGGSYTINLSPGTYQTFFYYGTSWNPTKKLSNGLTGGFMYDEQYGQDDPVNLRVTYQGDYIYYDSMTYSLQSVVGGNFRMDDSSASAVF